MEEELGEHNVPVAEMDHEDAALIDKLNISFDPSGYRNEKLLRESYGGVVASKLSLFGGLSGHARADLKRFTAGGALKEMVYSRPKEVLSGWTVQGGKWNKEIEAKLERKEGAERRRLQ